MHARVVLGVEKSVLNVLIERERFHYYTHISRTIYTYNSIDSKCDVRRCEKCTGGEGVQVCGWLLSVTALPGDQGPGGGVTERGGGREWGGEG